MNQMLLSAAFLQEIMSYRPDMGRKSQTTVAEQSMNENFAEFSAREANRDFFRKLAKPKLEKKSKLKKYQKEKKTILIIAPHPDDEILGAANLISERLKSREKIKIIYVTDGDAFAEWDYIKSQNYGKTRRIESIHAARSLGIQKRDLFFLGFPDNYLDHLPETGSIKSKFTGQEKTSSQSYFPGIDFSQENLIESLEKIIKKTSPDEIYFTGESDSHSDHSFIGELMEDNFREIPTKKFSFVIHNEECHHKICPKTEHVNRKKLSLIKRFKSQRFTPHHIEFLEQFAEQKEIFKEIK